MNALERQAAQLHARRAQPSESFAVRDWVAANHYRKCAPPGFVHAYEFTLAGERVGAALLGRPVARQYDADLVLELTRFYFVDETPTHVESRGLALLRKHVRIWIPRIRLLLAYSDPAEGHEGTIYEADGWCPLGTTDGVWGDVWSSRSGRKEQKVSKKQRWVRTP